MQKQQYGPLQIRQQMINESIVKSDCVWEGQLNVCLLSRQFSDEIQVTHRSWIWSWLAPLTEEWLKYVQSGQFAAAELESLHSAGLPHLN